MSGGAALDQGFENALALDDARESTFGIPAGRQIGNIGSLQGGQDEILNKLQRQQEMSAAGDKALDEVEKISYLYDIAC